MQEQRWNWHISMLQILETHPVSTSNNHQLSLLPTKPLRNSFIQHKIKSIICSTYRLSDKTCNDIIIWSLYLYLSHTLSYLWRRLMFVLIFSITGDLFFFRRWVAVYPFDQFTSKLYALFWHDVNSLPVIFYFH